MAQMEASGKAGASAGYIQPGPEEIVLTIKLCKIVNSIRNPRSG
jgi:hypothetical protein